MNEEQKERVFSDNEIEQFFSHPITIQLMEDVEVRMNIYMGDILKLGSDRDNDMTNKGRIDALNFVMDYKNVIKESQEQKQTQEKQDEQE